MFSLHQPCSWGRFDLLQALGFCLWLLFWLAHVGPLWGATGPRLLFRQASIIAGTPGTWQCFKSPSAQCVASVLELEMFRRLGFNKLF